MNAVLTKQQRQTPLARQTETLRDIRLWAYRGKQADAGADERRKILRIIEKLAKSVLDDYRL